MEANQYPLFAPGDILDIEGIDPLDIVLYAIIYGLCKTTGYCFASNQYLANKLRLHPRSIQRTMKKLHGFNLIRSETDGSNRRIYLVRGDMGVMGGDTDVMGGTTNLSHQGGPSIFLINKDNKIRETKITFEEQIEELYKNYPLKKGKTVGVKKLAKEIKTEEQLKKLETAIKNYSLECKGSDPKYIKHFSTFAGCWQDYLEAPTRRSSWAAVKLVDGKFVSADEQDQSEEP